MKRGAALSLPRCTDLVREDEDLRVERRLLRPAALSLFEHPLAHDVRADAVEDGLEEAIVRSRLTPLAKLELLAEHALSEEPCLERAPSVASHVLKTTVRTRDVAVERDPHADEHLAHVGFLAFLS